MTSYYQHLQVAQMIWDRYGPIADPFDRWQRHEVWRFDSVKISQLAPIVRQGAAGRELAMARWGLVPGWFKKSEAEAKKFQGRTFNARSETAAEKGSFKHPWKKRRCLVPAMGFYEFTKPEGWQKGDPKERLIVRPRDGEPMVFAGLWERWRGGDPPWETFTILTCPPNALVSGWHHRMPCILAPEHHAAWLDPATPLDALSAMLGPAPEDLLEIVPA